MLTKKAELIWYSFGVTVIILSAVDFNSYADAQNYFDKNREEAIVRECYAQMTEGGTVWGPEEFMAVLRRIDGNSVTLYGRDDYNSCMAGLDYEDGAEMSIEYKKALNNIKKNEYQFITEHSTDELLESALSLGVKYIVFDTGDGYEVKKAEELK